MKSFRLIFIDQDESYTVQTVTSPIKGFISVRAPKGTTEAMYFEYGNEKAIDAMIGLGTADWPDIKEAVAFNRSYGLYISAPPGNCEDYPTYYGGCYLTTKGLFNFWRVNDPDDPSFDIQVYPGFENVDYDETFAKSEIDVVDINTEAGKSSIIKITNIDARVFQRMSYFTLKCWADSSTRVGENEEVRYHLVNGKIFSVYDDEDSEIQAGFYELTSDGTYTIILGATAITSQDDIVPIDKNITTVVVVTPSTTNGGEVTTVSSFSRARFVSTYKLKDGRFFYKDRDCTAQAGASTTDADGNTTTEDMPSTVYVKAADIDTLNVTKYTPSKNTLSTPHVPYFDMTKFLGEYDAFDISTVYSEDIDGLTGLELIRHLILNGCNSLITLRGKFNGANVEKYITPTVGLVDRIYWNINVKNDCFMYVSQKSPNETPTSITISNIGYDKYKYDMHVSYILKSDFDAFRNGSAAPDGFIRAVIASNADGIIDVVTSTSEKDFLTPSTNLHALYQYSTVTGEWVDVTPNYKTKTFYVDGPLACKGVNDNSTVNAFCKYTIWKIVNVKKPESFEHETYQMKAGGNYPLKSDINYNTVTISCKEKVYPGKYTSGGVHYGSLNPEGVDAAGTNIFFPNVLPNDETATFFNVYPVHTLEELGCVNDNGFYTGVKIVDPIGPEQDTYTFTVKGQRPMTAAVQANIDAGTVGCAWTTNEVYGTRVDAIFEAAINDSIIECQDDIYDDALVIMECSGQEVFKSALMSLRQSHRDTSTIISPKIITKAEFNNPNTIVVNGRTTGTAQYIGEFKMYDSNTGKYYWCQPIGDVGAMLARIMEKKYGGIAPAGTNDSQGLGGVLPRAVLAAKWNFKDSQLQILDGKGLNPITFDSKYGLMIQGQKTTQDPDNVTDWSYLGHSMSFDLCKREIRDNVMVKQVHKRISDNYFTIREKQVKAILDKRTTGNDPIWALATVDVAGVNTPSTMAQRKFCIKVKVKVYVYSDFVELTFVTLGQE